MSTDVLPARLLRPRLLRPRLLAVAALVAVALVLVPAAPASAHAELLASDPAAGSLLTSAPTSVTLQFSEGVSLQPDGVRVLDTSAHRVDLGTASADGAKVAVPLGDLADGTYVVAWRVVSADSHPVRGAFTFSVGRQTGVPSGLVDRAFGSGDDAVYDWVAAVLRLVAYAGALGAAGYVLVVSALRADDDPPPVTTAVLFAIAASLVALLAGIPVQAALATGRGVGSITEPGVLSLVLRDGVAASLLVTVVGLLAMAITAGLSFGRPARAVALAGAVVAPVGFAITGHTRTMDPAAIGYLADAAHLWAGAVWLGGLVAVVAVVRRRRRDGDPFAAAEAVARFSGWAAAVTAAVVVAGLAMAWLEVGGWHALTTTSYGRLLLAKVALVAVVVAVAATNRYRLLPQVAAAAVEDPPADDGEAWRSLLARVRVEVVLLVAVLGVTSVLTYVVPAKVAAVRGPVTATATLGDGSVDVTVDPARSGRNDIHFYVLDAGGGLDDSYTDPSVRLELPAEDVGPITVEPVSAGPGHYQVVGTDLPLAGDWTITLTVKADRFTEREASVTVRVE